ncbi:glycosyltransferase [Photobacterium lipolyticum]|uniref:Glycosyltransferase n=1 Tax=Photobacterium lipolyticum TaxID=266810 RepID=A0A2T3MV99_9GAMM|nr:glycosyltransferase [Photobacterium lipolyticum]PSW03900.1 hypothetical protein C9I89_16045 [Photobacterium lipolyticum]
MINNKVGIVIVSYNAHKAVELTLSSLSRAYNETEYKVILIDNASKLEQRELIKQSFNRYCDGANSNWLYIQEEKNSGFSGGNNVGIKKLLDDHEVDQICLLNSDVIVTDHWLDRLIEKNEAVVSAVTNKADSEQCVPCDYDFSLQEALNSDEQGVKESVYQTINDYSNKRYSDFRDSTVTSDVTFFCVLLKKEVIQQVGLLDETFFPGGYEDDDYCLRLKAKGIEPKLCRDVFIHHWGSASFGQLQHSYFQENANKNRSYLEEKHNITWAYRAERPFLSYFQDISYCLENRESIGMFSFYDQRFVEELDHLVSNYVSESKAISKLIDIAVNKHNVQYHGDANDFDSIQVDWEYIKEHKNSSLKIEPSESEKANLNKKCEGFLNDINACQLQTINDYKFLCENAPELVSGQSINELKIGFWGKIKKAIKTIVNFKGIVFFGGYPSEEKLNDGYFQRINAIDEQVQDRWRVYVDHNQEGHWWSLPAKQVIAINVAGTRKNKLMARLLTVLLAIRCGKIYYHSVLRMHDSRFGLLMYMPVIKKIIDIHGVVPEEFRYHNDYYSACLYEKYEKLAVKKADLVLTVTDAMKQYLADKYRVDLTKKGITLPIFQNAEIGECVKSKNGEQAKAIYAGGLHKWQQVDKMLSAIEAKREDFRFYFFTPSPDIIHGKLSANALSSGNIEIGCKTSDELKAYYQGADYGFILREDIIVNNVSCPTKLIEYLEYDIIPVIDSPKIGDFSTHGMRYVLLHDFINGNLPTAADRLEMIARNREVINKLHGYRNKGNQLLLRYFNNEVIEKPALSIKLATKIKRRINLDSPLGKWASVLWAKYKSATGTKLIEQSDFNLDDILSEDEKFDVIIQVDNFVAGGLENVVIDINSEFQKANLKCCLVVFGTVGSAVEKARQFGLTVFEMPYGDELYKKLLKRVEPKVVMTHYSLQGLDICKEYGIYTIQVIHNMYMWFSSAEKMAFKQAAESTDCYVSVSQMAQDYAISKLGLPKEKCTVIPNGIDIAKFNALPDVDECDSLRRTLGISDDDFVYLSVGSINHQKNPASIVRAFAKIANQEVSSKLIMVGPIYEQDIYQDVLEEIKAHGLEERVIHVDHDNNIKKYYSIADVFVHSPFFEGGMPPLVILEAIASNLPVITIDTLIPSDLNANPAIYTVQPHVDLFEFDKRITDLRSSPDVEEKFAECMMKSFKQYERPNAEIELANYDKPRMFKKYIDLVNSNM